MNATDERKIDQSECLSLCLACTLATSFKACHACAFSPAHWNPKVSALLRKHVINRDKEHHIGDWKNCNLCNTETRKCLS